jgi:hypothetical protein
MPPLLTTIVALLFTSSLLAQNPGYVYTPEVHLGSATEPSTITVPPVVEVNGSPSEPEVSNAPPASTELLSTRHFDFIVSPIAPSPATRGSMADTSISLGEYARQLRAQKQASPPAIASPADSK